MQHDSLSGSSAQSRYILARAWHSKGKLAAAIAGFREALALDPGHLQAAILLGAVMQGQRRLDEAIQVYRQALEHHPNEALLHKHFVNVMLTQEGPEAVFRHYGLVRKDPRYLNPRPAEPLCCTVLRNELARLPYFLEYYRNKGIRSFLVVDNGSSDGSAEYLLNQPDVYLWQSYFSFNRANFGAGWFEPILRMHGRDHWCVIVDTDELLYYPDCEHRSIVDLCRRLDLKGKRAFKAIHLDMYSDLPIQDTRYTPGRSFEEVCPYFDRRFYHEYDNAAGPFHNQTAYFGGLRQRVFKEDRCYLSKVPLLKYDEDCILAGGQHWTNLPLDQIAVETGCLLHYKYFSCFHGRVSEEVRRKEHYGEAIRYRGYEQALSEQPSLSCYDPAHSVKLEDSRQLVRLGVMQADEPADASAAVVFPKIAEVSSRKRPFWSVVLTVYRRSRYLEQALRSVLARSPGPEEMEIEVVSDGPDDSLQADIEATVRSIAGERVGLYRHLIRAGQPEIFNVCVRRARGRWIHLLHDDDWVAPGFYEAMQVGIREAPDIGAAFCRQAYVDEEGRSAGLSFLERETPGTIDGWLDRIGCSSRLATPSIVVRREAYERLGGYCPQAKSAYDWEMWQRLSVYYPFWYDPKPLAFFRRSSGSESARVIASGEQIADTRAVIEIARSYLPSAKVDTLSRRAGEAYALRAFEHVREQMERGNLSAAIANLREGIRCSHSDETREKLFSLLRRAQPVETGA
ncbi:MAG: glycosyltransferase family 2 protein [Acidobacteriia bacterium]|nr:glycosyltransferase family 2 protein [Terriglobia bacterium]